MIFIEGNQGICSKFNRLKIKVTKRIINLGGLQNYTKILCARNLMIFQKYRLEKEDNGPIFQVLISAF